MICKDLDVAPTRVGDPLMWWQVAKIDRIDRVGNVHEGRAIGQAHDGVFAAGGGIRPAPDIVAVAAADLR
jgi:hypothetical protein